MIALVNSASRYGFITKFLHWLMALFILFQIGSGFYFAEIAPPGIHRFFFLVWHKNIGVLILFLVLMRFIGRLLQIQPTASYPLQYQVILHRLSLIVHYSLYGLMLTLPITGILLSSAAGVPINVMHLFIIPTIIKPNFAVFEGFKTIHHICAYLLCALLVIHIAAALYHHFVYRDNVLRRMLPGGTLIKKS